MNPKIKFHTWRVLQNQKIQFELYSTYSPISINHVFMHDLHNQVITEKIARKSTIAKKRFCVQ